MGRPTKWGNPFRITTDLSREVFVRLFAEWLDKLDETKREEFLDRCVEKIYHVGASWINLAMQIFFYKEQILNSLNGT